MDKQAIYFFIGSFIFGVAIDSLLRVDLAVVYVLFGLAAVLGGFFAWKKERRVFLVAILVFGLALGFMRIAVDDLKISDIILDEYLGVNVVVEGVVINEPDIRETHTRITVEIDTIFDDALSPTTNMIFSVDRFPQFTYGDRIAFVGELTKPENFETDNGRIFDYVNFLAKDNIHYTIPFPETVFVNGGEGNPIKEKLFALKNAWLHKVSERIPDPESSLLGGLVVGAKQSLGEQLEEDFRKTGIIHIVVLSGYNVTIVAEAIMRALAFLPMAASASVGVIAIILFAIMTGASATIVRASIMALLVVIARATGRTSEVTHALFIAAFFMVLHNPLIVLYDPSFQLSFLATIGLIYLAPLIEKHFKLVPTRWQLREFAVATIATQLFVLPLLLFMTGEFSLVALPVNLLILIFIPITMLFGFLAGTIGFLSSSLAFPFAWIANVLLSYELYVVDLFSNFSLASINIPSFPLWLAFTLYAGFGYWIYKMFKKDASRQLPN